MASRIVLVLSMILAAMAVPAVASAQTGPSNLRVVDLRASGATLTWTAPRGVEVYGYSIQDLLTPPELGNQVGYSFDTTGMAQLRPNTNYRLVVIAQLVVNGRIVDSPASNAVRLTTPADTTPPTAPTARAEGHAATSVGIGFFGSTDDVGIDSWVISDGTRTWTQPVWMQWRWSMGGLESNLVYTFTVRARDAAGNLSPHSNPVTFALEDKPPTTPTNLRVEGDELVWDASRDNVSVAAYEVFVDGDHVPLFRVTTTRSPLRVCDDPVNPVFCMPEPGLPHSYAVRAIDTSRNASPLSDPIVVPAR